MEWYYAGQNNDEVGPVGEAEIEAQIKTGAITRDTQVWRDGMQDWVPAGNSDLASLFPSTPPPRRPTPPPRAAAAVQQPGASTDASSFTRDASKVYPSNPPKSPHLCWLNLIYPGIAQITLGQTAKGVAYMGGFIVGFFVFLIPGLVIWIASLPDAFMVGKVLRSGRPVGKWQFFPS